MPQRGTIYFTFFSARIAPIMPWNNRAASIHGIVLRRKKEKKKQHQQTAGDERRAVPTRHGTYMIHAKAQTPIEHDDAHSKHFVLVINSKITFH